MYKKVAVFPSNICTEIIIVCNIEHANQPLLPTQVNKNIKEMAVIRSKLSILGESISQFQTLLVIPSSNSLQKTCWRRQREQ